MIILIVASLATYVAFVLARLGVHQRLPLALGPISLERIPDRAAKMYGERSLFTCDVPPEWNVPDHVRQGLMQTEWSAMRIQSTAARLAAVLHLLGVRRGDRVAVFKRNHFDIHLFTLGIVRCGGVACPINGQFASEKVCPYLDNIGAQVMVSDVATVTRVLVEGGSLGEVSTLVIAAARQDSDTGQARLRKLIPSRVELRFLEELLTAIPGEMEAVARAGDEILYLVHSSGTTGFPKAVMLSNEGQSHAVRGWLSYVHVSRTRDRGLLAVPNNHQAVILSFNSALLLGLRIHWLSACAREDFDPVRVASLLAQNKFTGFFAFPIAYTMLKEVDLAAHDLSAMRFWASTADAAHAAIEQRFVQHGGAFRELGLPLRGSMYLDAQGSSEVGTPSVLRYVTAYTKRFERRIGRPGSTPFGPRVRIARDGVPVVPGAVGRLEVKGRTVTPGYWNDHALMAQARRDGWFFTGDVACMSPEGHIIQLDREVDVIHTSDGPVYSLPIEEKLHAHPAAFDVCVYGARQHDGHQRPAAAVALRNGVHTDRTTLTSELNALLDNREQLAIVDIMPWAAFPIGITGKTLKRVFRERTESGPIAEANRPARATYAERV